MVYNMLSADYAVRVYAGVLGKMIGVYLGRPFEGWPFEKITAELGEITYYVHDRLHKPLIVADDDLSGTFTFVRALADYGYPQDLTAEQIGRTWLNYLIEGRSTLWWGGMGNSTEHTAYLRLKRNIPAPLSGSMSLNGQVVAEQIGAQIFIDSWALISPGNPDQAATLARKAASVSHDGEAIFGAQVLAAMEAQAFVEHDLNALLDVGVSYIPSTSVIARLIKDLRVWHRNEPDWRVTRALIAEKYGYSLYGGGCHVVPNHALIILALLYGDDDLQRSLMIANTSGWDTDCNSGNVGCLLGIKNGLKGIDGGPDWRGPVADRLYLSSADGGRGVTDAVIETYHLVNTARALAKSEPLLVKQGARFHFELPGSVQGFSLSCSELFQGKVWLENVAGFSRGGKRSLACHYISSEAGQTFQLIAPTFPAVDDIAASGYMLQASPTLYSGQVLRGALMADPLGNAKVRYRPCISALEADGQYVIRRGPLYTLAPGAYEEFTWQVPDTAGAPVASVGIELALEQAAQGSVYLDFLTWDGMPTVTFSCPSTGGKLWQHAWVNAMDHFEISWPGTFRLIQNEGRGLLGQGTREWTNYQVSATLTPHMVRATGIAARVQGMRRYYALLIAQDNTARLVKMLDREQILASASLPWVLNRSYELRMTVDGKHIQAWIDGQVLFEVWDHESPLLDGGIALLCEEGRVDSTSICVCPL